MYVKKNMEKTNYNKKKHFVTSSGRNFDVCKCDASLRFAINQSFLLINVLHESIICLNEEF